MNLEDVRVESYSNTAMRSWRLTHMPTGLAESAMINDDEPSLVVRDRLEARLARRVLEATEPPEGTSVACEEPPLDRSLHLFRETTDSQGLHWQVLDGTGRQNVSWRVVCSLAAPGVPVVTSFQKPVSDSEQME